MIFMTRTYVGDQREGVGGVPQARDDSAVNYTTTVYVGRKCLFGNHWSILGGLG